MLPWFRHNLHEDFTVNHRVLHPRGERALQIWGLDRVSRTFQTSLLVCVAETGRQFLWIHTSDGTFPWNVRLYGLLFSEDTDQ